MIHSKLGLVLGFVFSATCFLACADGNNANSNSAPNSLNRVEKANALKTNIEELGMIIRVPYPTEDTVWKEDAGKKIIAILRFSTADSAKIVAEAGAAGVPQNAVIEVEPWFSDELIAQSDMSGDSSVKGLAYPANAFFQEPYTVGKITRIEAGDYFILELSAK